MVVCCPGPGPDADAQQVGLADARRQQVALRVFTPPQTPERIQEHGRRETGSGMLASLGSHLSCAPVIDPPRPCVGSGEVMFQTSLEVFSLSDFFEESEPHVAIMDGDIARAEKQA